MPPGNSVTPPVLRNCAIVQVRRNFPHIGMISFLRIIPIRSSPPPIILTFRGLYLVIPRE